MIIDLIKSNMFNQKSQRNSAWSLTLWLLSTVGSPCQDNNWSHNIALGSPGCYCSSPCRKWLNTQKNSCWLRPNDQILTRPKQSFAQKYPGLVNPLLGHLPHHILVFALVQLLDNEPIETWIILRFVKPWQTHVYPSAIVPLHVLEILQNKAQIILEFFLFPCCSTLSRMVIFDTF